MTTRYLMNDRKEKAMKAFGMGGYKKGGHVTEISIMMGSPKGTKKSGMGCNKSPVHKAFGGTMNFPLYGAPVQGFTGVMPGRYKKGGTMRNKAPVRKSFGGDILDSAFIPSGLRSSLGLKKGGICHGHKMSKMPTRKADGGSIPGESPEVEQNIDGANQMLRSGIGLKKGGQVNKGRVKKSIGGEMQKASIMGLPGYLMNQAVGGYKKGGRVRKAEGGNLGLSKMSNRDFDAGKSAMGLKRGGNAKSRTRKADGGALESHARPLYPNMFGYKNGGDVRMAAGGVGKIRHHQMSKSGKPMKPSSSRKNCRGN